MLKQISLAVLAATFITGGIGLAHAESNVSGSEPASSAGMQSDMRGKMDSAGVATGPSSNTNAYGYAADRRPGRLHNGKSGTKHNNNN